MSHVEGRLTVFQRAVLEALGDDEATALEVAMQPENPIGLGWNLGSVLMCLRSMTWRRLVEARPDGAVQRYRITELGKATLRLPDLPEDMRGRRTR